MSERTYPTSTCNRNVPNNAFLLAEVSYTSGEYIETVYIDPRNDCGYKVGDWVSNKPVLQYMNQLCRATGDTEKMIALRYRQHKERLGIA